MSSHIELAKAEAGEIMGEIGRAALFAAVAFGALLLLGFLLPIGIFLFVGDWLFGSIGWGVLHGTLFLVAVYACPGPNALSPSFESRFLNQVLNDSAHSRDDRLRISPARLDPL